MCNNHSTITMPFNIRKIWCDQFGPNDNPPQIDSCIAYNVWKMVTQQGIRTLNSCCGHGRKLDNNEGEIMIDSHSVYNAIKAGYDVKVVPRVWINQGLDEGGDGGDFEGLTYEVKL